LGAVAAEQRAVAQQQPAAGSGQRPNILVIWGDDIGVANLSAYSFGVMGYKTPNIDRIAREGMMFTDYYAGRVARPVAHRSSPARQVCGPA
jgi:arylsulfatase